MHASPLRQSENFEGYCCQKVYTLWQIGIDGAYIQPEVARSLFRRTIGWGFNELSLIYPLFRFTTSDCQFVIDPAVNSSGLYPRGLNHQDYTNVDTLELRNLYEGTIDATETDAVNWGYLPSGATYGSPQVYRDCTFRTYWGISSAFPEGTSISNYHEWLPTEVLIDNCIFDTTGLPANRPFYFCNRVESEGGHNHAVERFFFRSFNGVAGDDFQVFHLGQAADWVVPTSATPPLYRSPYGAPPAGTLDPDGVAYLTGQTNLYWSTKAPADATWDVPFCIGGEVAPEKVGRAGVVGYVG
jgi:hypothetical protein